MNGKVGNLPIKRLIASMLVFTMTFVYVVGDNFSFLSFFKNSDRIFQESVFDTGMDGLRDVSELTLAETGTEMGKVGEDLSSGFEKLVSACSNKKTFDTGKSEFVELVSDLKKQAIDELDSTNNSTKEYNNYRSSVLSGFEELENCVSQLDSENSKDILQKIKEKISGEQPYIGLADELPFNNVSVDDIKTETYDVPKASSYAPDNKQYSQSNLDFTNDAVINDNIRDEFSELSSPLEIYQYIKNNYMPEFYYGSRKGSVGAFEEKAGNDYDLSSLFIAVLRDRNIPARYVRGEIEITAEQAIQWSGAKDIYSAARIIAALGIPVTTLTSGNNIVAVRLEHVWVEAYVPYTDYRGAGNQAGESLWIPLDVSFKEMQHYDGIDLMSLNDYLNDENNFLTSDSVINDVSVENLASIFKGQESAIVKYMLENGYGDSSLAEIYGGKNIVYEDLGYLPLTLPYTVSEKIDLFDDIPFELTDSISFSLSGNSIYELDYSSSISINQKFYTPDLYGKRIILAYTPATDSDKEILDQYGDIFSTPAYLLKLKPQLIIDGEVIAEGAVCNAGYMQKYTINIHNASEYKSDSTVQNSVTAGGIYCIALNYGKISENVFQKIEDNFEMMGETLSGENVYTDAVMGEILNDIARVYFAQIDIYNGVVAGQNDVVATRDLSIGIVGFKVNVIYTFNRPSELREGGIFLDIRHDVHSVVSNNNDTENEKMFMLQAGMYASAMEHSVLEQITGVESVSTMKILGYASENNIPIHMIDRENLSDELDLLNISDQVKQEISTSVNSGKLVIIPEQDITINQWSGIGYMVLDPDTYACGYMISGGMAGGAMTWDEVLAAVYLNVREGFKTMLAYMAVLVMFPELWPVFVIIACIGAFSVGWSIGTHIYNCITTGDVREYQEAMVEIASFCFLIAIGEGIKKAYREPETAKQAGDEMAMAGKNNSCFIAGTLVSTKSGMVSIETISVGDIVYSFNAETQEVSEQTVEEIFIHESNQLVYLNVGNETITTTPEHPFYIPQKGFVNAIDLRAGDTLWTVNGEYVIIEKIQHEILESPVKVYNFRVANNHTYFVGNVSVGVHNSCENDGNVHLPIEGEINAKAPVEKFSDYIFKDGATHGKNIIFENLGYSKAYSEYLANIYETQAAAKYANGEYTLGKLDMYGQRINIEIELRGIGEYSGKISYLNSGWMINSDGSISLNTPFAGFTR